MQKISKNHTKFVNFVERTLENIRNWWIKVNEIASILFACQGIKQNPVINYYQLDQRTARLYKLQDHRKCTYWKQELLPN
jgi:hypothetical protein